VTREGHDYAGVRVSMNAHLQTAVIKLKVDVNVGDPVLPEPIEIEMPSVLDGQPPIKVIGYPLPMVFAEKLVTAVARGVASTRWRDFADVVLLSSSNSVDGNEMAEALDAVATYRQVTLQPLREVLDGYATLAQERWRRWLERQGLDDRISSEFDEVPEQVFTFADPPLTGQTKDAAWTPESGWIPRP